MKKYRALVKRFWEDEQAATAAEYGIIIALVAVAIGGTLVAFSSEIESVLKKAVASMQGKTN